MSPLFRRGELKAALLDVLGRVGPANGYVIMHTIAGALGDAWQPSPGAVYPALLALEDSGLIEGLDRNGARLYALTAAGRRELGDATGTLDDVAGRVRSGPPRGRSLGRMLDEWAGETAGRDRRLDADQEELVRRVLLDARDVIERIT